MARALDRVFFNDSESFTSFVNKHYNCPLSEQIERYSKLTEGLQGDIKFFSSPGRVELIGNHTDHNNGYVLATAINLDTIAAVIPTSENKITINSEGYVSFTVGIDDLVIYPTEYGTSKALVRGVLKGFLNRGLSVGGFIANVSSTIFKGAGVSSSAAFELLICEILNVFYNENKVDYITKALISQYAENIYFGKPSGLMDQLIIAKGGVNLMDFYNHNAPVSSAVVWSLKELSLVIINCGGDHSDLTEEYTDIREDMSSVARTLGKSVLREVSQEEFYKNIKILIDKCGGRAVLRAKHFLEENERVKVALNSIIDNNVELFLECINMSGISSYSQLQNCYAQNDKHQNIPLGINWAKRYPHLKAVRVHGGGFAGTILAIIERKNIDDFKGHMGKIFDVDNIFAIDIRSVGATVVEV